MSRMCQVEIWFEIPPTTRAAAADSTRDYLHDDLGFEVDTDKQGDVKACGLLFLSGGGEERDVCDGWARPVIRELRNRMEQPRLKINIKIVDREMIPWEDYGTR